MPESRFIHSVDISLPIECKKKENSGGEKIQNGIRGELQDDLISREETARVRYAYKDADWEMKYDLLSGIVSGNVVTSFRVTTIILSKRRFRTGPRSILYVSAYSKGFLNEYVLKRLIKRWCYVVLSYIFAPPHNHCSRFIFITIRIIIQK